jgi:hypothetical protein
VKKVLNVVERLVLVNMLPQEGNWSHRKVVREVSEEVDLDTEERTKLNLRQGEEGKGVMWDEPDPDKPYTKECEIKPKGMALIIDHLSKMDKDEKLEPQHDSLYEKFVEEKGGPTAVVAEDEGK